MESDFSDLRLPPHVVDQLVMAAACRQPVLLVGAPGAGKMAIARRLPGLLPAPSEQAVRELHATYETTSLHPPEGAPFRAPHHTCSVVALMGGGPGLKPGEVCLAHTGVLYLDEVLEFSRTALDSVAHAMKHREVTYSRDYGSLTLPADFWLVMSAGEPPTGETTRRAWEARLERIINATGACVVEVQADPAYMHRSKDFDGTSAIMTKEEQTEGTAMTKEEAKRRFSIFLIDDDYETEVKLAEASAVLGGLKLLRAATRTDIRYAIYDHRDKEWCRWDEEQGELLPIGLMDVVCRGPTFYF